MSRQINNTSGLGNELATNGSFDFNSDWTATNSTISISNGVCQVNPTSSFGYLNSTSSFQSVIGKKYVYSFDCISRTGSGNVYLQIGTFQNGSNVINQNIGNIEDNTSYSFTFTATSTTSYLRIGFAGSGTSATIDNVSVREVSEPDTSGQVGTSTINQIENEQTLQEVNTETLTSGQVGTSTITQTEEERDFSNSTKTYEKELVTNGNFDDGSASWSLGSGWSIQDDKAYSDNTQTDFGSIQQYDVTTIGKTYELRFNLNLDSGVTQSKGSGVYETYYPSDNGEIVSYFVADSTTFRFANFPNNTLGSIDNISVKEVVPFDDTSGQVGASTINQIEEEKDFFNSSDTYEKELVTNGDFSDIGVGNVLSQSGGILVNDSNRLKITSSGSGFARGVWETNGNEGDIFIIKASIVSEIGSTRFINVSKNESILLDEGEFEAQVTLGSAGKQVGFGGFDDASFELIIDNVSIKKVVPFDDTSGQVGTSTINQIENERVVTS